MDELWDEKKFIAMIGIQSCPLITEIPDPEKIPEFIELSLSHPLTLSPSHPLPLSPSNNKPNIHRSTLPRDAVQLPFTFEELNPRLNVF